MLTSNEKTIRVQTVYLAAIFCATVLLAAGGASGDVINWDNPAGGSFDDSANWNPAQIPGTDDTAVFNLSQDPAYEVTFDSDVTNDCCHFRNDKVNMALNGATYTLKGVNDSPLVVGVDGGETATVAMSNGELQTPSACIGLWKDTASGLLSSGVLEIRDMSMDVAGQLTVGNDGDGTLNVYSYGGVTTQFLHVGSHSCGNTGRVKVEGDTASLTVTSDCFIVGVEGTGYLEANVEGIVRSTHAGGWIIAGDQPGSYGEILVDSSMIDAEQAPMLIGNQGEGKLTLTSWSEAHSSGELFVGGANGSDGEVLITNGSKYTCDSVYASKIGDAGTGKLTIEDNHSRFKGHGMVIGDKLTGDGTVGVYSGSKLEVNFLRVGREGNGLLDVNGGVVTVGDVGTMVFQAGEVGVGTGGELGGTGVIRCTTVINASGEVRPGGTTLPTHMTGILNIDGAFAQQVGGTLVIEVGGLVREDEHSVLNVDGDVKLAGTLTVELFDGFQPQVGDTFDILDWSGALSDTFDVVTDESSWDISKLYSDGEITYVPEPATLALLGIGGLMALRRRKRN